MSEFIEVVAPNGTVRIRKSQIEMVNFIKGAVTIYLLSGRSLDLPGVNEEEGKRFLSYFPIGDEA